MSVSYVARKCTSCAGTKFDYDKEAKMWKCLYCGAVIERHEQVDTMFTIKNVVRQAILDIAYKRMSSAQNNLVECKKIDSRYVGTLIADIAYEMNMIVNGGISKSEQQNYFSMLKKNYMSLKAAGDKPTEEEIALYDFFDSSEVVGVLILVFDSLNAAARRDFLLENFDPSGIYSMSLNSNLINFAVKSGNFALFEKILHNTDNIDKKAVLKTLLNKSPDNENKADNALFLITKEDGLNEDDKKLFENYISSSEDSAETKCRIATVLCGTRARPSVECLMNNIITKIEDAQLGSELMGALIGGQLVDVEIATIVDFSLNSCSSDVCLQNLDMLHESGNYVELSSNHFNDVLSRDDLEFQSKKDIIASMMEFEIQDKVKYRFISDYLCDTYDTPDNRYDMISFLLSFADDLPTNAVEKYILKCSLDKENKPEVIKLIFACDLNLSFFNQTLSNYILNSTEKFDIKREVIWQLFNVGLRVNSNACAVLLMMQGIEADKRVELLRIAKSSGINYDDVMEIYLTTIDASQFEAVIFNELLQGAARVSTKVLYRYVIEFHDYPAAKVGNIAKMMQMSYLSPSGLNFTISFCGEKVVCNLIQAYILLSAENVETSLGVLEALGGNKNTVSTDIDVSGSRCKFKKYAAMKSKAGQLSDASKAMCYQCRIL